MGFEHLGGQDKEDDLNALLANDLVDADVTTSSTSFPRAQSGTAATSTSFWDHFSRILSALYHPTRTVDMLYLVPVLIGC